MVPKANVTVENEALTLARFREANPRESVFMNIDPLRGVAETRRQPFTAAEWKSVDPDRPVLNVTTLAPGLLVIGDTWMPGWTARLDGVPTPVFRGNIAQKVIPVRSPGRHEITLEYRPPGLLVGCIATSLSCVIWGVMCGRLLRLTPKTANTKNRRRLPRSKMTHRDLAGYSDCVKFSGQIAD